MAARFTLGDWHYAHRGLWRKTGPTENSLAAYRAAAEAGYGIEFDLRPSIDGVPLLFHDPVLDRMTNDTGPVAERTGDQLQRTALKGSDETIPVFSDLLDLWPDDLPLLAELKIDGLTHPVTFARDIAATLQDWNGPAAIMSFSTEAVEALPDTIMRGQLVHPLNMSGEYIFDGVLRHAANCGVDYLCVWHEDALKAADFANSNALGLAIYTSRNEEQHKALLDERLTGLGIIFEHYDPRLAEESISQ